MELSAESIWLATAPVDMRTGIDGLSLHVHGLGIDALFARLDAVEAKLGMNGSVALVSRRSTIK